MGWHGLGALENGRLRIAGRRFGEDPTVNDRADQA
jgi:hypothetical protein